jgi:hypothetical protein
MGLTYSKLEDQNHVDSVLYEIDMLRFTTRKLVESDWSEYRDAWVYLESFLVHYRNLIDFFGKQRFSDTDVHVSNIWKMENIPTPSNLPEIEADGVKLRELYEPKRDGGRISQYVQHLTTKRIEPKNWQLHEMLRDLDPLLAKIENHLRPHGKAKLMPEEPMMVLGSHSASTSVCTETAGAAAMLYPDYWKKR